MKKLKEIRETIKKNPKGEGILFFAIYFVAFFVIIVFLRLNNNTYEVNTTEEIKLPFAVESLISCTS